MKEGRWRKEGSERKECRGGKVKEGANEDKGRQKGVVGRKVKERR